MKNRHSAANGNKQVQQKEITNKSEEIKLQLAIYNLDTCLSNSKSQLMKLKNYLG